jgi:hypothetical protein
MTNLEEKGILEKISDLSVSISKVSESQTDSEKITRRARRGKRNTRSEK